MRAEAGNRRDRLREMLADLKMPGALEAVDGILAQADSGAATAAEAIEQLLDAQIRLRNNRRLQTAMRSSRLPAVKTLAQFDFAFQPSIKREQIESLHELGFLDRRENIIFLGPPGVGKTHLAISLAVAAAESGRRVYYGTLAGLIESLMDAKAAGDLSRRLRVLTHPALLVVDEIGYLPVTQDGAVLFFQLINARHERASTVLTSNKGFEDWGGVLGDEVMAAALIDRLLHHCHIVNIRGNSYRMREHQNLMRPAPEQPNQGSRCERRILPIRHPRGVGLRSLRALRPTPLARSKPTEERQTRTDALLESVQFSIAKSAQFSVAIDKPTSSAARATRRAVYPRACGGTYVESFLLYRCLGLSPRVRGTTVERLANKPVNGLSPRVRGNRELLEVLRHIQGSIPARAGEPHGLLRAMPLSAVYPRACGEPVA